MSEVYRAFADAIADPSTVAFVAETDLDPVAGPATPIAPPTYAGESREAGPAFAVSRNCPIPKAGEGGWHTALGDGARGDRVIVNSIQAEAGRAETALWDSRGNLGLSLPGLVVVPPSEAAIDEVVRDKKLDEPAASVLRRQAAVASASSWTLAHRQVDAWLKFAVDESTEKQVWEGGPVKDLIVNSGPVPADDLYRHFPNSALYGFWLSAGVARRIQHARSYSSEVVGYGASPIDSGATKLDAMGGASKVSKVTVNESLQLVVGSGKAPSEAGFGQIPTRPGVHAFVCEPIVQHSSLSLRMLGRLRFADDPERLKWRAAATALTLLGVLGRALANDDTFLRSGCSLVPTGERWGWRFAGTSRIEPLAIPSIEDLSAATRAAIEAAGALGLAFAAPIDVAVSKPQLTVMAERIVAEVSKQTGSGE